MIHRCSTCAETFPSSDALLRHMTAWRGGCAWLRCSECRERGRGIAWLSVHYQHEHMGARELLEAQREMRIEVGERARIARGGSSW
ncbi:MAG TPA: C2H2-type zinc finger protein [Spirochaetia bacterium]